MLRSVHTEGDSYEVIVSGFSQDSEVSQNWGSGVDVCYDFFFTKV